MDGEALQILQTQRVLPGPCQVDLGPQRALRQAGKPLTKETVIDYIAIGSKVENFIFQ